MALPKKTKKDPRPLAKTFRVSRLTAQHLRVLALEHNLSQADVIEHLVQSEWEQFEKERKRK